MNDEAIISLRFICNRRGRYGVVASFCTLLAGCESDTEYQ